MMNQDEIRKLKPSYWVTYLFSSGADVPLPITCFFSKEHEIDADTFDITFIPEEAKEAIGLLVSYGFLNTNTAMVLSELRIFKGLKLLTFKEAKEMFPDATFYPSLDELLENGFSSDELKKQIIVKDDLQVQYAKFVETCKGLNITNYDDALAYIHDENRSNSDISLKGMVLVPNGKYPEYLHNTDFVILTND